MSQVAQIEPQKDFPIVINLDDPTDNNTYYVRAYIYDGSDDDTLLDTVDLTDNGSQRFKKNWHTVADPSGQGRYITIFTKVFTDSGYTQESDVYARTEETYLIKTGFNAKLFGGGGGGSDIDYKKINRIVKKALKKLKIPQPQPVKIDITPIMSAIIDTQDIIANIKIPEQEKPDLRPVVLALQELQRQIQAIPHPEKIDLSPVLKAIKKMEYKKTNKKIEELFDRFKRFFVIDMEKLKKSFNVFEQKFNSLPMVTFKNSPNTPNTEEMPKEKVKRRRFF